MSRHQCCACFTHNNLPCCNEGHVDHTGAQAVRKAWARSPLLQSVRANLAAGCDHQWLDRPESDSRECLICGDEVFGA